MLILVRTDDIVTSEACMAKNKHWNDMTSPSVDYGYYSPNKSHSTLPRKALSGGKGAVGLDAWLFTVNISR